MENLCEFIHAKDNSDRLRTRAMLCHIYHHALHNRWFQARDLMKKQNMITSTSLTFKAYFFFSHRDISSKLSDFHHNYIQ
jgi:hypothetical protein